MINSLLTWFYVALFILLFPLAKLVALFNSAFARQLEDRTVDTSIVAKLKSSSTKSPKRAFFFASSAGEFEQALPLIHSLEHQGVFTHTFFFSRSGLDYANARDISSSYSLAPYDLPWCWRPYFEACQPQATIVVRYELWPGFLAAAKNYCPLYLVNASKSHRRFDPLKKFFLKLFSTVFFVADDELYRNLNGQKKVGAMITGDTKYDRVIERTLMHTEQVATIRDMLQNTFDEKKILVLGSCWSPDIEMFLSAWHTLPDTRKSGMAVIFAPHDISDRHLDECEDLIRGSSDDCIRFSRWMNDHSLAHPGTFILLDTMGKLAEVYGAAHCAFVGGALHNKVHNVLEPASYGLGICFGPRFKSQKEAVLLVEMQIATVVSDQSRLAKWLVRQVSGEDDSGILAKKQVEDLSGATAKILANIPELIVD